MSSKVCTNAASALKGVLFDGMTIMAGGFGLCGIPEHLITALHDSGVKDRPGVTVDEVRARTEASFDVAIRVA